MLQVRDCIMQRVYELLRSWWLEDKERKDDIRKRKNIKQLKFNEKFILFDFYIFQQIHQSILL